MIRARKRFGQHFLHDPAVIARMLRAVALQPGEAAVEIGPGRGALTAGLLQAAGRLDAIEIDRDLCALLRARFGPGSGLALHEIDVLQVDWRALARERGQRLRLIGNLPYNLSTPLLFRLLECAEYIRDMHFMLQKEVVDRILAAPGSGAYGRLTVMLAPHLRAERVLDVGPGAFQPPPQVSSSVVHLTVVDPPARLPRLYAALVAAAFSQRRKTLRNGLRSFLSGEQIAASGIDPGARPERLTAAQFAQLAATAEAGGAALAHPPTAVLH